MVEVAAEDVLKKRGRKPKNESETLRSSRRRNLEDRGINQMDGMGSFLSNAPMVGRDLVEVWGIPASQVESVAVLIFKQVVGMQKREVIERVPVIDYSLPNIIAQCGPGTYFVKGAGGAYQTKIVTIHVSDFMARNNGWGRMPDPPPPPPAADLQAVRTLNKVAEGLPTDQIDLVAAIQRASEQSTLRVLESMGIRPGSPMVNPQTEMNSMMQMLTMLDTFEERAMKIAARRLGMGHTEEPQGDDSTTSLLLKALPSISQALTALFSRPGGSPAPAPTAGQTLSPSQSTPLQPEENEMNAMKKIVERMTPEEQSAIIPALAMLKPFAGSLLKLGAVQGSAYDKALELSGYIPDAYANAMIALCDAKDRIGLDALTLIGQGFATPAWGEILSELKKILIEKYQEG